MHQFMDFFDCSGCKRALRSRVIYRGTDFNCPYCGTAQKTPGRKKGLLGKAFFVAVGGVSGDSVSMCPWCNADTPTFGSVCQFCCRDLPPLVG